MGALGLECRGRRPQGKGCLLLAVAGAASLVTLLLAVPITVLAVLALVPQEQGGLVSGCHKSSKGLTSGCASCLFLLSWLGCPPVGMSPLSLCWSSFHVPVMLLCPDVTKPLSGCLYVSSPLPKTYLGLCLSAQVYDLVSTSLCAPAQPPPSGESAATAYWAAGGIQEARCRWQPASPCLLVSSEGSPN